MALQITKPKRGAQTKTKVNIKPEFQDELGKYLKNGKPITKQRSSHGSRHR